MKETMLGRPFIKCWMILMVALAGDQALAWETLLNEPGRKVEYDSSSLSKENGKVTVSSRVTLEIPLTDLRSGSEYQLIEATTRYDCTAKTLLVLKRALRKANRDLVREELATKGREETPIHGGTVDERLMSEVCKPGKAKAAEKPPVAGQSPALDKLPTPEKQTLKSKAEAAAASMRAANDATLKGSPAHIARRSPASPQHVPMPHAVPPSSAEEAPPAQAHVEHAHWAYEGDTGPAHWADLDADNAVCRTGSRQSPINIEDGLRVDLEPIRFDYAPGPFSIIDNGHTLQANFSAFNSITLTGKIYRLIQVHFHHPSEERINGQAYPMVAHFVHKSEEGDLAVVAVLLQEGPENPVVQTFWNYIPLEQGQTVRPPEVLVDPGQMLPAERGYYTFMGSLTTPPCTEGVLWLVMKTPATLSAEQIAAFSRLYPYNARPVQSSGGRLIKSSR